MSDQRRCSWSSSIHPSISSFPIAIVLPNFPCLAPIHFIRRSSFPLTIIVPCRLRRGRTRWRSSAQTDALGPDLDNNRVRRGAGFIDDETDIPSLNLTFLVKPSDTRDPTTSPPMTPTSRLESVSTSMPFAFIIAAAPTASPLLFAAAPIEVAE